MQETKRVIRFLITGGLAALSELIVFVALGIIDIEILVANSLSFMTGLLVSFAINRLWVFSSNGDSRKQFAAYFSLALINLVVSNITVYIFINIIGINQIAAKIATMAIIATWNYIIFSKLIFHNK